MHNKPICNCPSCRKEDSTPSPDNWREESYKKAPDLFIYNRSSFSDLTLFDVANLVKDAFIAGYENPSCNSRQEAFKLCNTPLVIDPQALGIIKDAFLSGQDHRYYREWASQFDKDSKVFSPLAKRWEIAALTKGKKTLQEIIDSYQPSPSADDIFKKLFALGEEM